MLVSELGFQAAQCVSAPPCSAKTVSFQKPWRRSQRILSAIGRRRWVAVRQQYAEAEGQAGMAVLFDLHGRRDFFRSGELPIFCD